MKLINNYSILLEVRLTRMNLLFGYCRHKNKKGNSIKPAIK